MDDIERDEVERDEIDRDDAEHEDARDMMRAAARMLERWRGRLQETADHLASEARYQADSDAPTNLDAAWQSTLESLITEELQTASEALKRAAEWTGDPASWRRRP